MCFYYHKGQYSSFAYVFVGYYHKPDTKIVTPLAIFGGEIPLCTEIHIEPLREEPSQLSPLLASKSLK